MDEVERHRLIGEIFLGAVEIEDPEDRARYLTVHCGEHSSIRRIVQSMIDNRSRTLALFSDGPQLRDGMVVGNYVIEEILGAGAFGEVYVAERQGEFRKRVAIKILKRAWTSPEILSRFRGEKQMLAAMNHRNVVGIHDDGTTLDGRPYFVTDLIFGSPITKFCDDNGLGIEERLALFQQICDGVLHAHQKTIVHRDLKPANILVSGERGDATPKIIDFGIGKALDREIADGSDYTSEGGPIGTAAYMPPEQWRGIRREIDTRSDIYSLGVVLYQLLTGKTPFRFEGLTRDGMRRVVLETEPELCSERVADMTDSEAEATARTRGLPNGKALARRLRGDLDSIMLRCLEKERDDRFPTVSDLAADITAYRSHNPVAAAVAKGRGVLYRARKFVRRNRQEIAAAGFIVIALAFAGMWHRARQVNQQGKAASFMQEARMLSYRYPRLAAEQLQKARDLFPDWPELGVDQAYVDIRRGQLSEANRVVDRVLARFPEHGPALAIKSTLIRNGQPSEEADALEAKATKQLKPDQLHYLALGLDDHARAIKLLSKAIEVAPANTQALWQRAERYYDLEQSEHAIEDAKAVVHLTNGRGLAWNLLGACTLESGRQRNDTTQIRASLSIFDKALGQDHTDPDIPSMHVNRAMAFRALHENEAALGEVSRAVKIDPLDQEAWELKAAILFALKAYAGAEEGFTEAIQHIPDSARLFHLRGQNRYKHFHLREAVADFDRAMELTPIADRAKLFQLRGLAHRALGDYSSAVADSEKALELRPDSARAQSSLAWALLLQGNVSTAHKHHSRALSIESIPTRLVEHAFTSWLLGDDDTAVTEYEQACEASTFENACIWAWEIEARRSRSRAADRLLKLAESRAKTASPDRRAFVAALVAYARAPHSHRSAALARVTALALEESWTVEAEYIFGCVAAASGDANEASRWFTKCAAHQIPDWLDRDLAIARLELRR